MQVFALIFGIPKYLRTASIWFWPDGMPIPMPTRDPSQNHQEQEPTHSRWTILLRDALLMNARWVRSTRDARPRVRSVGTDRRRQTTRYEEAPRRGGGFTLPLFLSLYCKRCAGSVFIFRLLFELWITSLISNTRSFIPSPVRGLVHQGRHTRAFISCPRGSQREFTRNCGAKKNVRMIWANTTIDLRGLARS